MSLTILSKLKKPRQSERYFEKHYKTFIVYLLSVYGFDFSRTFEVTLYHQYDICNVSEVRFTCKYGKISLVLFSDCIFRMVLSQSDLSHD